MAREFVRVEIEESIAVVTIDRPPVNAMNNQLMDEICQTFDELSENKNVLVVILTGAGERAFSAGGDISLEVSSREALIELSKRGHNLTNRVANFERPVICAINGLALGGGCEIALACDIRIASEKVKIGQPEINLAVFPGAGGTQRLPRLIGIGKAKKLLFTGNALTADEACSIGLVDRVVPQDQLLTEAKNLALKIAAKGPVAMRLVKKCVNEGMEVGLQEGLAIEAKYYGVLYDEGLEDMKEGMKAFFEKTKPKFRGR